MEKIRVNREIIRAREIIAELRLNNEKAHQLTHTLRNLRTVQMLIRESIYRDRASSLQFRTESRTPGKYRPDMKRD
jgi:hypothetical protein